MNEYLIEALQSQFKTKTRFDEGIKFSDGSDDTMWVEAIKQIPNDVYLNLLSDSIAIAKKFKMEIEGDTKKEAYINSPEEMNGWIETLAISPRELRVGKPKPVKAKKDGQRFLNAWATMVNEKYSEYIKTSVED